MTKSTNVYIQRMKRKKLIKKIILLIILLIALAIVVAQKTQFFIVDTIVYDGDRLITGEFVNSSIDNVKGNNIFTVNSEQLIKNVMKNPYIDSITISKKLPRTLKVNVKEKEGIYYEQTQDIYQIISSDLHLLEKVNSLDGKTLIEVKGLDFKDKEVGMKIEDNTRLEKVLDLLYRAQKKMQDNNVGVSITAIDVSDMSNIRVYFGNIEVMIGNDSDLTKKLSDAMKIYIEAKPTEYIKVNHKGSPDFK